MLELVDLMELEVIVASKLGVASSHRVGGFQQVVAEVSVAGFNQMCTFSLEIAGLVLGSNKASKLGN